MRLHSEEKFDARLEVARIGSSTCFCCGGDAPDTSGQNAAAQTNADIAREMWGQYQTTYLPKEQQFTNEAFNYDTQDNKNIQAGLAKADVTSAFDNQRAQSNRQMASMGIAPGSGAWANNDAGMRMAEAAAGAGAQNAARRNVDNMGYARMQDAISIGKGMPGTASASAAQAGTTYGGIANNQLQSDKNNNASMGSAVQGGMDLYKTFAKDGGLITKPKCMAAGGIVGNPRMKQVMDNNAASASVPVASGPDQTGQVIDGAKMAKTGYDLLNAPAKTGMAAMDGSAPVMAADIASGEAGLAGMAQSAPIMAADVAAADAAGTAAASTGAGAAGAGLTAALASVPVAGWIALAGLAASQLKDGGGVGRKDIRKGGAVTGPGTATSDSIPAQLSDGEYVINAESVKMIGKKKLDKMNAAGLAKRYGTKGRTA